MIETPEQVAERRAQYLAARSGAQRWPVDANRYRNLAKWTAESDAAAGMVLVQGWQDIASAPRDGTPFVAKAYVSHSSGAAWEENHVIWCDDETGEIHNDCEQGWQVDDYSLWMPLPAYTPPPAKDNCNG